MHLGEEKDDVVVGVRTEEGVPRGGVWLGGGVEECSGVAREGEARAGGDESGGDVIVGVEAMGEDLGLDLVEARAAST